MTNLARSSLRMVMSATTTVGTVPKWTVNTWHTYGWSDVTRWFQDQAPFHILPRGLPTSHRERPGPAWQGCRGGGGRSDLGAAYNCETFLYCLDGGEDQAEVRVEMREIIQQGNLLNLGVDWSLARSRRLARERRWLRAAPGRGWREWVWRWDGERRSRTQE